MPKSHSGGTVQEVILKLALSHREIKSGYNRSEVSRSYKGITSILSEPVPILTKLIEL